MFKVCHIRKTKYGEIRNRSSRPEVFCKEDVYKNCTKFTASACNFIKKETLAQVFSSEFYEIFKNSFFHRTPPVAVSEGNKTASEVFT